MGTGASKTVSESDNEFIAAEARQKAADHSKKLIFDHFADLEKLDPRVPREEQSLEVVLREMQESGENSQEAAKSAQMAAEEANIMVQEMSKKLCPRILKALKETEASLQDPEAEDVDNLLERLDHFKIDHAKCEDLQQQLEDLAAKQRKALAKFSTANHNQRLAANAAVQALMNPMVGLNPRKHKFKTQPIKKAIEINANSGQRCHMECSRMKSHIEWPFENDPEQQEREQKPGPDEAAQADPAVGRLPILDQKTQGQVKRMLRKHFF